MANQDRARKRGDRDKINPIQVQKFLGGVDYPADKDDLVTRAREKGADEGVMRALEGLPEQRYQTPADVSEALGQQ